MSTYVKLAWRNLFRNKRRTLIAGTAIGLGLGALIFTDALIIGMEKNMIHTATASYLGEGQIHREKYMATNEVELTVNDLDSVIRQLDRESVVTHYTLRTMSFGMITSPANVSSVNIIGINPSTEIELSQIDDALIEGEYFSGANPRDILVGSKLAEIMEVELGDRVVMTVAQAHSGDLSQEMFRISGIYHFNAEEMDRGVAVIRCGKLQEMLGLGDQVHEIALTFTDDTIGRDASNPFWADYSRDENEAVGWIELLPQLEAALEFSQFNTVIVGAILFAVVTLGIINTLFMSLHERMFEFGVLRAVGTRPSAMAALILLEAGSLAVISILLGCILGAVVTSLFGHIGIDYTGIEFVGVTFRELLYPELRVEQFVKFPLWVFLFTIVVGLYPGLYAARMKPAEAMRRSL